jgi:hypothetical protein
MIAAGVLLILLGIIFAIPLFTTLGSILAIAGVVLWILGAMGRAVGPRAHYW